MFSLRATISESKRFDARETNIVKVRAMSRSGAVLSARMEAAKTIPFREQSVVKARPENPEKLMNLWEVEIREREPML